VIAVDTNLLVYAHRKDSEWHDGAAARLRELAEGRAAWAIPWACLHEFLAIVTHPRIYDPPTPVLRALEQVDAWLESPALVLLAESVAYWEALRPLIEASRVTGPQIHDARVAALCAAHGVAELWSADRDFNRFPDLPVRNPLVPLPAP
jgi:hypothetical protein